MPPSTFTLTLDGVERLIAKYGNANGGFQAALKRADTAAAAILERGIKAAVPVGKTGFLRDSWQHEPGTVFTANVYARRIWKGFKPGVPPQQGRDVRGRQYHQEPNDYVGRAINTTKDQLLDAYTTALTGWVSQS